MKRKQMKPHSMGTLTLLSAVWPGSASVAVHLWGKGRRTPFLLAANRWAPGQTASAM